MKKIYLFLTFLFGLLGATSLSAQSDFPTDRSISIGTAVGSFEPETWYFMFQGRQSNGTTDTYEQCNEGDNPTEGGGVLADCGIGADMLKKAITDLYEVEAPAAKYAGYVCRFIPVDGKDGCFIIQFGTGNYMTGPEASGDSKKFTTTASVYDAGEFNIYNIDETQPGHFGFNVYNMGQRIDNNGTGNTVVTWSSGERTQIEKGNSIWSIHEVIYGETIDPLEIALDELMHTCDEYEALLGNIVTGTEPGQYSEQAYNAVRAALDSGYEAESHDEYTADDVNALKQAIIDAYNALLETKVAINLNDGYYRIRSGMLYTNNVPTGETDDQGNPVSEPVDMYKYLYTNNNADGTINARWKTLEDADTDGTVLWKITNTSGYYDIVSAATDARFNNVSQSTNVTLSTESTNLMELTIVGTTEDGENCYNIRVKGQTGTHQLLHQGGHSNGAGVSGNVVGWATTYSDGPKASEWVLEPVSDSEAAAILAAYDVVKQQEAALIEYRNLYNEAAAAIVAAKDEQEIKLITENSQFSSPWTEASEGSLDNLLDGNNQTFWHSAWSNGQVEAHLHYLQVALHEPVHELISYTFSRRNGASNDHTTAWSIYGSNDPEAADESWEELMTWNTPYGSQVESFTSEPFDPKGYQYFRIFADATTNNRGYWHVSEVQFSYKKENPNSQYSALGSVAENLDKVLEEQKGLTDEQVTPEVINALKTAYDAFKAGFVDPQELREALAQVENKPNSVLVGNNPGFWSDRSTADALQKVIDEVKAYDAAGSYTAAKSKEFIDQLNAKAEAIDQAANTIQEGKWYRIRFGTEEEYDEFGWDKVAGEALDGQEPLWGKYVTVATTEGTDVIAVEANQVALGANLHTDDITDVPDDQLTQFRFILVGDTAYAIQNRATGMFLKASGTSGDVRLNIHPSLFKPRAIGYGQNAIASESLKGAAESYLHAAQNLNKLVTWNVDYPGSRSGLYIEEVEAVDGSYNGTDFRMSLQPASITAFCFPVEVSAESGMYSVARVENNDVVLVPITTAAPGRPFIYISAGETYDPESEGEFCNFTHGYEFVSGLAKVNGLVGTYEQKTVGPGVIVPEEDKFIVTKRSNTAVAANHAWIQGDTAYDLEATITYTISDEADGIAAALNKVSREGDIYTIDGRIVGHGNLNSIRQKGVYILNGAKVVVK